jgi:hypothetical protein
MASALSGRPVGIRWQFYETFGLDFLFLTDTYAKISAGAIVAPRRFPSFFSMR